MRPRSRARHAQAASARVADEDLTADAITVAAPLHDPGIPALLETWVDVLFTDPRLNPRSWCQCERRCRLQEEVGAQRAGVQVVFPLNEQDLVRRWILDAGQAASQRRSVVADAEESGV
ncbi:NADPH-dependent FMN reductase family protein [Parafrankia discariae]|uniref:hypothetical protein n=1 Tax=Parafrankia discariae TaxID=365528 RepID=UPI000368AD22|nr:hypothetical protein [Parafrankia discariae]